MSNVSQKDDPNLPHCCANCCAAGYHLFDRRSVAFAGKKACRCGKVQGVGPRNRSHNRALAHSDKGGD